MAADPPFKVAIPARYASTRLPGKPLLPLNGQPMIRHVWECARGCGAEEVVIATDDDRIADAARGFGAEVVVTSAAHPTGTDRLAELAALRGWGEDTVVVNLQGDEPLTPPAVLRQVAANLHRHPEAGIATLCTPIHTAADLLDPHVVKVVVDAAGFALYFSRAPIPWQRDALQVEAESAPEARRHLGIYAYRVAFLRGYPDLGACRLEQVEKLEQLRALWNGVRIHVDLAAEIPGHGVDTPEDVERVEALLARRAAHPR